MLLIARYTADCGTRAYAIEIHDLTMTNQYMNVLTESDQVFTTNATEAVEKICPLNRLQTPVHYGQLPTGSAVC